METSILYMTGADKPMNYPKQYHIRVSEKMFKQLKKIGSKRVRVYLEKLVKEK